MTADGAHAHLAALVHGPLDGIRLIEASAGTGKTWTLCGLVVRLLLETPLTLPQLLVVTFTKAAAAELRTRIRSRIDDALARVQGRAGGGADAFVDPLLLRLLADGADRSALERRLALALQSFDEASIFTIHGFCQRALSELALSVGLAPAPTLVDDDSPLALQVAQDFWRRRVAALGADTPAALALGAALLRRRDSPASWAQRLRERQRQPLAALRWPEATGTARPDETAANLDPREHSAWTALDAAHAHVVSIWRAERDTLIARLEEAAPRLPKSRYTATLCAQAVDAADQVAALPWHALAVNDPPKGFDRLGSGALRAKKGHAPPPVHAFDDAVQALLDRAAEAAREAERLRLALLRDFLEQAPAALAALKRAEHVAGFDDLLLDLHRRLVGETAVPGLAAALRARFPAALIDEFQDTDPLQYAIFDALYGGGADTPVALVGDPKQAIYSFRSADLPTYLQARAAARAHATLRENQRSTGALLQALNGLFTRHARPFMLDGLDYTPVRAGARERPALVRTDGRPEPPALQLWTLPDGRDGGDGGDGGWLPLAAARRSSALACAGEIARRIDDGRAGRLTLGDRAFAGGDIAVLVRTHAQGREMRRALAALGVASIELSPASVFASADAEAAELVLGAVLEPTRLSALRAALATDWLGADAATIAALADEPETSAALLQRFAAHHERWRRLGVAPMLRRLVRDEGVTARLLARPDGERRLADLLHLVECLQEASAEQRSPQALLRWLQAQRAAPPVDEARQLRLESDRHLVQVVTVHKSKGLEYPVVFCPFLWDLVPPPPLPSAPRTYHDDDGRQVLDYRPKDELDGDGVGDRCRLESAAESLRMVYVALTRAVHQCVLVVGTHRQGLGGATKVSGSSVLNWLVAGGGSTPAAWLKHGAEPEAIAAAWQAFAAAHAPAVGLAPLSGRGTPIADARPAPASVVALPSPPPRPPGWQIGSYSALVRASAAAPFSAEPAPARDHDLLVAAAAAPEAGADRDDRAGGDAGFDAEREDREEGDRPGVAPEDEPAAITTACPTAHPADAPTGPASDDILQFPRGAQAGECLHALFEWADFTDPAGWPLAIERALQAHPPRTTAPGRPADPAAAAASASRWPRQLAGLLQAVVSTELPGGVRLDRVPPARRLNELEFHLPVASLSAGALASTLAAHGHAVPPLGFVPLHGYLHGFVDLVFEHEGRFHLVDWKSNHLGSRAADYAPAAVADAVRRQAYELQALLYAVALHRHLARRLSDYDPERHLGSLMVLFVRGVRPDWPGAGVWSRRPGVATIRALSALLDDAEAAR